MTSNLIDPFVHNNYTKLARVYKMKKETFSNLIEPARDNIKRGDPFRNQLTWREVWTIVDFLGLPDPYKGIDPLYYNTQIRLAELYKVDRRTFGRWLDPIRDQLKIENKDRRFFTPKEVRQIVRFLGLPG